MTSLQWENSPFEPVASVCNFHQTKIASQQWSFKKALLKHFEVAEKNGNTVAVVKQESAGVDKGLEDVNIT